MTSLGTPMLAAEFNADFYVTSAQVIPLLFIVLAVEHRWFAVTADTYTHVLTDEAELDYERLLAA